MQKLVRATSLLTFVSIGDMVLRFVRTKTVAMLLGKEGTGFLAQLMLFFELLRVWGDLGGRRSVIKQVAECKELGRDSARYREIIKTSFAVNLTASLTLAVAVVLFSPQIARILYGNSSFAAYVAAVALILPFSSLGTLLGAIIKGNFSYSAFAGYTLAAFACVFLSIPLIHFLGMWGAVAVLFCYAAFPLFAYLMYNRREPYLTFASRSNPAVLKEQLNYGAIDIAAMSFINIARIAVAAMITKSLGLAAMGLYQVVLAFSYSYLTVLIQAVTGYTLPSVAAAKTSEDTSRAINDTLRFLLFVITPVVISLVVFPEFYIHIFYNDSFIEAALPLQIQLVGTMCSIVIAAMQPWLFANNKYFSIFVVSMLYPIAFFGFSMLWLARWGLSGVSLAGAVPGVLVLAAQCGFMKYHGADLRLNPKNIRLVWATLAWFTYAMAVGILTHDAAWRFSGFAMAAPWFFFSSKDHERDFIWKRLMNRIGLGTVHA